MNKLEKRIDKAVKIGVCAALGVSIGLLCVGIVRLHNKPDTAAETTTQVYIVHTDSENGQYAVLTDPSVEFDDDHVAPQIELTEQDRERVARIVAGQAVGKTQTCQRMIAQVMYNQMLANDGKIDGTEYAKYGRKKPTEDTYAAVDAIFLRGEWLLDDTVLWTGNAENPDEWHQTTLQLVTVNDGIAFYEKRK